MRESNGLARGSYPRAFGKYVLVAPLARGGMGELHLAVAGRDDLKKLCAIKRIRGCAVDDDAVTRFIDEAKVMVKLGHGNLVPVFESGRIDDQYYLVMEYIEGRDLRALWRALDERRRTCPLELALHIVKEICRGLHYVHNYGEMGLVHRDISPPNVLLSSSGEVKVADFGLAYSRLKVQKTAPGVLFGKLSYMPPEQARREPLDARADIYSTGVILWELVTGRRLFPLQGTLRDRLERASSPQFDPPSSVNPALPAALDLIVTRALAPHPDQRYASAEMMRRDLAGLLAGLDPTTDATSLQQLLGELFGADLASQRRRDNELLDRHEPEIRRLQDEHSTPPDPGGLQQVCSWQQGYEIVGEKTLDGDAPDEDLSPGTILGQRYRIDKRIGAGGMGVVYRATHIGIEREVAIKVLHPLFSWQPEVVSRFQREAKAASRIGHPNIVEIFDSGTTEDGCLYFAMEYLEGEDLADVLRDSGRLSVQRAAGIGRQICQALHAAHRTGIVHRDLKPENIFLVAREGQPDFVKLLDFGVARNLAFDPVVDERLTNPGIAMGTPEYMAPEQAEGQISDHRADIYATGAILYQMLDGSPPDSGRDTLDVFSRKATGDHTPIAQRRPEVPEQLARLIHTALAFAPADRHQSAGQLAYELTRAVDGRPTAVAALLGLAHPQLGFVSGAALPYRLDVTGPGYPAVMTPTPFSGPDEFQTALQTAHVPVISRPRHTFRNVAIGVALVIAGATIGAVTLRRVTMPGVARRASAARSIASPSEQTTRLEADDVGRTLERAEVALAQGEYARALEHYRRILASQPGHEQAKRGLGQALTRQRERLISTRAQH